MLAMRVVVPLDTPFETATALSPRVHAAS